ncbi:DUF4365 domain-containing protein [Aliarcobacter skirrowii]|uniref:DUF4365 domain-containing protein n=1 Tax=Aliarcobacter skirrowii TaxID=28200 RepID=UPI0029A8CB2B|nr:DUF4365 domain-containing protein [Aliarcobacter skirrowii]MDX3960251.1 DUF4365 domain-containing protein [Aliarcobacter skirrowii]
MSKQYETEELGLLRIQSIINGIDCGWQSIDQKNDKGLDGFIIIRKKHNDTGNLIFVQVKTGSGYKYDFQGKDYFGINLNRSDLDRWKKYWKIQPIPVILLYVNPEDKDNNKNSKVWWVNLKDDSIYPESNLGQIHIKKSNRFGLHSKGDLFKLCGRRVLEKTFLKLKATKDIIDIYKLSLPIRSQARLFYKEWQKEFEDNANRILVNRVGWRHITRRGRSSQRVFISFQLLGIAKKILELYNDKKAETTLLRILEKTENKQFIKNIYFYGIRCKVSFDSRSSAIIQVILKKSIILNKSNGERTEREWFYSVHELKRGHKLIDE